MYSDARYLFGSGYIGAAVPGLKLVIGIFAILALLDQLLQRVCVRLADNLCVRARPRQCVNVSYNLESVWNVERGGERRVGRGGGEREIQLCVRVCVRACVRVRLCT
jgi:hypothetical protein